MMCTYLPLFVLLFGCQILVECGLQTMTKKTGSPGYYSGLTATYAGPNAPSVFQGLEKAGYSRTSLGQRPKRRDSLLRKMKSQGSSSGRLSVGSESPPRYGRQDSHSNLVSAIQYWRKEIRNIFETARKSKAVNTWRQKVGGMNRKPPQVIGYGSDNSDGYSPKLSGWAPLGRNSPSTKRRNGDSTGGDNRSRSDNFHQECLDAHNEYREEHGVPPLRLNDKISLISQRWAEHLADRGSVDGIYHSDRKEFRKGYGENIYAYSGFRAVTGRTAVGYWYNEINNYDFRTGKSTNGKMIGHLTQLLWKDSQELGVGYAFGSDGAIFVVCHYNPPGNYEYQNIMKVPPIVGFSDKDLQRIAEKVARRHQMIIRRVRSFVDKL